MATKTVYCPYCQKNISRNNINLHYGTRVHQLKKKISENEDRENNKEKNINK